MAFQPFHDALCNARTVAVPPDLDDAARAKFLAKLAAAVKQQQKLAEACPHVLRISGETVDQGAHVLIPHEPARVLNPAVLESDEERPEIGALLWLAAALNDALLAAAEGRVVHGGIQAASVYQDETGLVKLGDFGIAAAYEASAGTDARREACCEVLGEEAGGQVLSGRWALLGEDEPRDYGWLVPYFGPELFEGKQRLNPKSDQFALGVVLFMLATGTHPYGASLDDPSLMFFLMLEPYAPRDSRPDWEEAFERAEQNLSSQQDAPILTWSRVVQRMLASDPSARFESPKAVADELTPLLPEGLVAAAQALGQAGAAFERGAIDECLERARAAKGAAELPELWRARLEPWLADIEARKGAIGRTRQLRQLAQDAQRALDQLDLDSAERIANEVLAAEEAEEDVRQQASETLEACQEQRRFIESGADSVAEAYLETAREAIEAGELHQARETLEAMLADPATPAPRATQARERLTEIELIEQRTERQVAALEDATQAVRDGDFNAAQTQLDALRADAELPEALAAQVGYLLEEVARGRERNAQSAATLDEARTAWMAGEAEALRRHLDATPETISDRELAALREELRGRLAALEQLLEQTAALEAAVAGGDYEAALERGRELPLDDAPESLRARVETALATAEEQITQQRAAAVATAQAALEAAAAALEELDHAGAAARVREQVLSEPALPRADRERGEQLLDACQRLENAVGALAVAADQLERGAFDEAEATLGGVDAEGLPDRFGQRFDELAQRAEEQRAAFAEQRREELRARLAAAEADVAAGRLAPAASALREVQGAPQADDALRAEATRIQAAYEAQAKIAAALDRTEQALGSEDADLDAALAGIHALGELPAWADERARALIAKADRIADERRDRQVRAATSALDAAEKALGACELDDAGAQLERAGARARSDKKLAARHAALAARLSALREWLPRITQVEQSGANDPLAGGRAADELLARAELPGELRSRVEGVRAAAERAVAAQRSDLDAALGELGEELERRGRRVRDFFDRLAAIEANPAAGEAHRARAGELRAAFEQLPEPKSSLPLIVAGVTGVVAVVGAGLAFSGLLGGDAPQPGPQPPIVTNPPDGPPPGNNVARETPPTPAVNVPALLQQALVDLRPRFAALREQARRGGREAPEWTLAFEPADRTPTALVARRSGAADVPLADVADPDALARIDLTGLPEAPAWDQLFAAPPPPPDADALTRAYASQVQAAGAAGLENVRLTAGDGGSTLRVQADYRAQPLAAFTGLTLDVAGQSFSAAPDEVAAFFGRQIDALELVADRPAGWVELAEAYDGRITPAADAAAEIVGASPERVQLRLAARLPDDDDAAARFTLSGAVSSGVLVADDAGRDAFEAYLRGIQQRRLASAAETLAAGLSLPAGTRLAVPDNAAVGERAALSIRIGPRELLRLDGAWAPGELLYRFSTDELPAALRARLTELAATPAVADELRGRWADLRGSLAPTEGEPGGAVFGAATLAGLQLLPERSDAEELLVGFDAEITLPGVAPLTAPVTAKLGPQGFEWTTNEAARTAVVDALATAADSAELRGERARGAVAALAGELGADAGSIALERDDEQLTVSVPDERGARRFAWRWSAPDLDWGARRELERMTTEPTPTPTPPVATLDGLLEQLAQQVRVPAGEAADALAAITRAKLERFGAGSYQPLGGGLGAVADRWASELGGTVAPVLFVEYYVGQENTYALSWRRGDANATVWKVTASATLRSFGSPERLRSALERDARLGEALLGPALGDAVRGSAGGLGIVIAPDDLLWMVRWPRVTFNGRPHSGVGLGGANVPGTLTALAPLIEGEARGREFFYPQARLWCAPTLAAAWSGRPRGAPTVSLSTGSPTELRFQSKDGLRVATITDDSVAPLGRPFYEQLTRDDIGNKFWSVKRDGTSWEAAPYVSFAVLPTGN